MSYIELKIEWENTPPVSQEIMIAQLSEEGFDGFQEEDDSLLAYIEKRRFSEKVFTNCKFFRHYPSGFKYTIANIDETNWNHLWESNFEPVIIQNCMVRAPFHTLEKGIKYDIVIEPKMSFGTGHHETTSLMIQSMLNFNNFKNKSVLDMGCGTAVLAILAAMLEADVIDAVDNNIWAWENACENVIKNNMSHISVFHGGIEICQNKKYDIIIANITRNILLDMMPHFSGMQTKGSVLFLSGFFAEDVIMLEKKAQTCHYRLKNFNSENKWTLMELYKM